ncbi:wings apart-like protein homolog isoform X2 [Engraulis encrasicolus]|uniref:wings apart-like protein homolog isoform X2 n=1 Tax=Engraulis encrasicolus TaxID=184585 RepID=UPI002FD00F22
MTSRFYKTYSRKGGSGDGSKFDEVFSNKKTMSKTKWGETTYRATKAYSKRPGVLSGVGGGGCGTAPEPSKRSRLAEDADNNSTDDPFGFDSDEESQKPKPVSSRSSPGRATERPPSHVGLTLEPNSRVSEPASVEAVAPSRSTLVLGGSNRSSYNNNSSSSSSSSRSRVPEVDPTRLFSNSSSLGQRASATPAWLSDSLDRHRNWYKNASESDHRPHTQTTTLRTETSPALTPGAPRQDAWDLLVGLHSSTSTPSTPAPPEPPAPLEPFSWALAGRVNTVVTTTATATPLEQREKNIDMGREWSREPRERKVDTTRELNPEPRKRNLEPRERNLEPWETNLRSPDRSRESRERNLEPWERNLEPQLLQQPQQQQQQLCHYTEASKNPLQQQQQQQQQPTVIDLEEMEFEEQTHSQMQRCSSSSSSGNYRTYRRPNSTKGKASSLGMDSLVVSTNVWSSGGGGVTTGSPEVQAEAHQMVLLGGRDGGGGAGGGGGRQRDFTVLHPSSFSVNNVTIRDQIDLDMDRGLTSRGGGGGGGVGGSTATLVTSTFDPGESGRLRRGSEATTTKPSRSAAFKPKRPDSRNLFGFDDEDIAGDDPISDDFGGSSYKIQYFGFDDMSESGEDDDDEDPLAAQRRQERKKAKAEAKAKRSTQLNLTWTPAMTTVLSTPHSMAMTLPAVPSSVIQPVPRGDAVVASSPSIRTSGSMEQRSWSATEAMEQRLMSSRGSAPTPQEQEQEPRERRKIFGPKRSPTKAVYNARHWNHPESEEVPPVVPPSQTTPVSDAGSSSSSNNNSSSSTSKDASSSAAKDDGVFKAPQPPPKVIKTTTVPTEPYQDIVTALKCRKEHKELFTVVQHVKHFNDVVEFGENQEFTDDFEYLATGLKSGQPMNTRCLSVITLASRCATPSFRMHLRARGKVAQVFKTLNDAPQHPNLALCTASLMYILSRDRLNMDLDRACLELMIRLLELEQDGAARAQLTAREMAKVREKIRKLCETVHNKHLDLENITTGHLAMETLLSLTSKRAGDWFKEELRLLGGLDHIVDKVKECVENLEEEEDKEKLVDSLWGSERCLRVLESVTVHNAENQSYLIAYKDSQLIVSSAKALRHCEDLIQRYSREVNCIAGTPLPYCSNSNVGKAVEDCMRAIIGVLLNLTHDNEWGSTKTGEQKDLIITALHCVLRVPQYLPQDKRFDIRVLGLGLLINLVEYSARNRHCLVEMQMDGHAPFTSVCIGEQEDLSSEAPPISAIAALVQLFLQREQAAILAEAQTDDIITEAPKPQLDQSGEWQESEGEIQWVAADNATTNDNDKEKEKKEEEEEELDLNKALHHAGKHMEDSIVASYTALLLGCLCQESPMNVTTVRENLPRGDFSIMTEMLKKFLNFMNLTCDGATAGQKSISRVIDYLEHC